LVRPYGLVELVKSGRVALSREPKGKPAPRLRAVN
jgi:acetolactate synthase small subunit